MNAKGYKGTNPAADLKFFLGRQPSKRARKRDLQWFRQEEARRLLVACRTLKPRWFAFLLVSFGGGTPIGRSHSAHARGHRLAPRPHSTCSGPGRRAVGASNDARTAKIAG